MKNKFSIAIFAYVSLLFFSFSVSFTQTTESEPRIFSALERSPDGTMLAAVGQRGVVLVYDLSSSKVIYAFNPDIIGFLTVTWSPDSSQIAAAGWDRNIFIWCVDQQIPMRCESGTLLTTIQAHDPYVFDVDWSPDGTRLASVNQHDGSFYIWDAKTYQRIGSYRYAGDLIQVDWNFDSTKLALTNTMGSAWIIDASLKRESKVNFLADESATSSEHIAWHPTQNLLAITRGNLFTSDDTGSVEIWDVETKRLVSNFQHPDSAVISVAWSPDGKRVASFSTDRKLRVWAVDNAMLLQTILLEDNFPSSSGGIAWDASGENVVFGGSEILLPIGMPTRSIATP